LLNLMLELRLISNSYSNMDASTIAANLQASQVAEDAAVAQAITDLQALVAAPGVPASTATVVSTVETITFSDGSTVTVNGTVA
jgi:hypothetical protein